MRFEICSITLPKRRKAGGRGSITLAEAIAIISPTKPSICQSGHGGGWETGALGVGDGTLNIRVGETGSRVFVEVAEGSAVVVVASLTVGVTVGQVPSGMEILPAALAHRL